MLTNPQTFHPFADWFQHQNLLTIAASRSKSCCKFSSICLISCFLFQLNGQQKLLCSACTWIGEEKVARQPFCAYHGLVKKCNQLVFKGKGQQFGQWPRVFRKFFTAHQWTGSTRWYFIFKHFLLWFKHFIPHNIQTLTRIHRHIQKCGQSL